MTEASRPILFDAGLFIGGLLQGDPRNAEARSLVEAGRQGSLAVCTTIGILSEVYAALTWVGANPPHLPSEAAEAVRLLVEPPSHIQLLESNLEASLKMLQLAEEYGLTARRIHDARHAAIALTADVTQVYTFEAEGLSIAGPESILA